MKSNHVFMAFASGSESKEFIRKLYIGVAPVYVLAVNPTKEEREKLLGVELDKAPEYMGEAEVNGTKVPQVRINFVVKVADENIDLVTDLTFFLNKTPRVNKDNTKVQIIDKYGRTAWATKEEFKSKSIPVYSNGNPANIDKDYRSAFVGEELLTNFIKNYLNIPSVEKWENKKVVGLIDNPENAEARLDDIEKYFKGDFSELKAILRLQPKNRVKCMFGVRTTEDNNQYQTIYNRMTLKLGASNYSKLDADLQQSKSQGAYSTTEFSIEPLHEYTVKATNFSEEDPLGGEQATSSPWDDWNK